MQLGHIACMSDHRLAAPVLFEQVPGPGINGRPKDSWRTIVQKGLTASEK